MLGLLAIRFYTFTVLDDIQVAKGVIWCATHLDGREEDMEMKKRFSKIGTTVDDWL